ncbi:Meteorin-like protein [Triplophysa tibetana]|uniref:Meteorin-like protein n=1 Tax=Triplophysa tibetana TaxID=1572043 RepID=A0A5A9N5Q4_9TELE|nr:Meteorin-like protein [Triplophysa tibetana]
MLSPLVACLLSVLVLCRIARSQYSSDQCSWRGSGLTHEGHTRDVEQVYLRCAQGFLEWLYPTGAIIINLRPNTMSPAASLLSVCIKPSKESSGAHIYLDRLGKLRMLLREEDQAEGKVHCFSIQEGALFIEAVPQRDISRKITSFQYELVNHRPGADPHSLSGSVHPSAMLRALRNFKQFLRCCEFSNPSRQIWEKVVMYAEVLLSVCTSDFVASTDRKRNVFVSGGGRAKRWTGFVKMPSQCRVKPGDGEFLFTGTVRFGEAWLSCAPRYKDFLRVYQDAQQQGTNPSVIDL